MALFHADAGSAFAGHCLYSFAEGVAPSPLCSADAGAPAAPSPFRVSQTAVSSSNSGENTTNTDSCAAMGKVSAAPASPSVRSKAILSGSSSPAPGTVANTRQGSVRSRKKTRSVRASSEMLLRK